MKKYKMITLGKYLIKTVIIATVAAAPVGWFLIDFAIEGATSFKQNLIGLLMTSGFGGLIGCFISFLNYKRFIQPSNEIIDKINSLSKKDLTQKVNVEKASYMKEMAHSLNTTIETLGNQIKSIKESVNKLKVVQDSGTENTIKLHNSTSEVMDFLGKNEEKLEEVTENFKKVDNFIIDLSSQIEEVISSTHDTIENSNKVMDFVEKNKKYTEETNTSIINLNESFQDIEDLIVNFNNQTKNINNIVGVINGIAEKTNLLSLNASIEAAHAGTAGLGFSVVASEIKNLALQSQKEIENIEKIIYSVQTESNRIVSVIKNERNSVSETKVLFDEMKKYFDEIVNHTEESNEQMNEIISGTNYVGEQIEEVSNKVKDALNYIESYAYESKKINETIKNTDTYATENKDNMIKLKNIMNELVSTTDEYIVNK